ncbi:unnamed protein product [Rotaria sp. Silwood2]|nr:unnamed protein product [Rotaria sp. Silwood2]
MLHKYLSADQAEFEKAEKLVLQCAEFHRNLRQSHLYTTQVTPKSPSNAAFSRKQEQHYQEQMPLSSLNRFLKTCRVEKPMASTAAATIKDDISIKQQISFYMANVKDVPHFAAFWRKYGIHLPDLVSVLKYHLCMQYSSVPCKSSFSASGYMRRTRPPGGGAVPLAFPWVGYLGRHSS